MAAIRNMKRKSEEMATNGAAEEWKLEPFRTNAFRTINKMVELNNLTSADTTQLLDEILHSIFFLGKINTPPFPPEQIFTDAKALQELKNFFPRPFELCSSQLPRRSPFSCVLDMIVHLTGEKNENDIIEKLQEFICTLDKGKKKKEKKKPLTSSTICVSHSTEIPNSVRYYGVSMSTSGPNAGEIMIAASCLSNWHSYVADAVMTYYPVKIKKTYFDGTITLPEQVRCQAFDLSTGREMSACKSCGNLFGLTTSVEKESDYGNCAEAESVSNLLEKDEKVREQARQTARTWTDKNRQTAEESVKDKLRSVLRMVRWDPMLNQKTKRKWDPKLRWDGNFYTPHPVQSKRG